MKLRSTTCIYIFTALLTCLSCNKRPYKPDFKNIGGYVIGKETCHSDEAQDYWLVDFTVHPNTPQIGDTLTFEGITYSNVLKVKGLAPSLQQKLMRVSIDYKIISNSKVATTGCNVPSPVTYLLKELFIINQGEIR